MKRDSIPELLGAIVLSGGVVVMAGWFLGIEALKSVLPVRVSMKFSTAFSFFLSGIALYYIARFRKKYYEPAIAGYVIDQPLLYYSVTGKSSAMALHTAILFVLWGQG